MIKFLDVNINDLLEKNKDVILKKLISFYGVEYADTIIQKVNSTYFNFSSNPYEDYKYASSLANQIDSKTMERAEKQLSLYKEVEKKVKKELEDEFIVLLQKYYKIDISNPTMRMMYLAMFMDDEFCSSRIDAFGSKKLEILNNPLTSPSIKESLLTAQKCFVRDIKELFTSQFSTQRLSDEEAAPPSEVVDEIIRLREILNQKFKESVMQKILEENSERTKLGKSPEDNISFGQSIYDGFDKKFGNKIDRSTLSYLVFHDHGRSEILRLLSNQAVYECIRIPLTLLFNRGIRGFDVTLIHEIIHTIERGEWETGICDEDNIANEIRVQKLAIKITTELHNEGIFVLDNPKDYKIAGESEYEQLFSLVGEFFDEHEKFIDDCAITNDLERLYSFFGEDFKEFRWYLKEIYNQAHLFASLSSDFNISEYLRDEFISNKFKELIEKMNINAANFGSRQV